MLIKLHHYPSSCRLIHQVRRTIEERKFLTEESVVTSVQANLVLGLRELLAWTGCNAWMYIGLAIRMANALRLTKEYNQRHDPIKREIRRRTMWACVVMDRLVAYSNARPQTISIKTLAIHLPSTEAAFLYGEESHGPMLHDLLGCARPLSEIGTLPYFLAALVTWGKIADWYVTGGRAKEKEREMTSFSEVLKLQNEALEWLHNLPTHIQWSQQNYGAHAFQGNGQGQLFLQLHILIRHCSCLANHEYLPHSLLLGGTHGLDLEDSLNTSDLAADQHVQICIDSVNETMRILQTANMDQDASSSPFQSPLLGCIFTTIAGILSWARFSNEQGYAYVINHYSWLRNIICSWQDQWPAADAIKIAIDIAHKLYSNSSDILRGMADHNSPEIIITTNNENDTPVPMSQSAQAKVGYAGPSSRFKPSTGDGLPEPTSRLYKPFEVIRAVLLGPLESPEYKKAVANLALRSMLQQTQMHDLAYDFNLPELPIDSEVLDFGLFAESPTWDDLLVPRGGDWNFSTMSS